jgi:hypothetical protein
MNEIKINEQVVRNDILSFILKSQGILFAVQLYQSIRILIKILSFKKINRLI